MRDALTMQVLQSIYQLFVDFSCVILAHSSLWLAFQEAMRTTARYILENEYNLVFRLDCLVKLGNVWM